MTSFEVNEQASYTEVTIGGGLTIYNVQSFFKEHVQPFVFKKSLILDLSKIEEIDTAGIQLLLMLTRAANDEGVGCEVSNISGAVKDYLELFNLTDQFPLSGLILA